MDSNAKRLKSCSQNEDGISALPDALLCHILSCFSTREAVRTSVLSHRWKNVWASVPILDFDEEEKYRYHTLPRTKRYRPDWFAQFVNRVLMFRCPGDIHRFRLVASRMHDVSLIHAWIATAIRRNVLEFDLSIGTATDPHFEVPKRLFMCRTLVSLKLWLRKRISVITPSSNCFPCLKFLHVRLSYPDSDSMEKFFSRFPVLEDLIIAGNLEDTSAFKLDISAPKLKRLQIKLYVHKFAMVPPANDFVNYVCQTFINVDAPNLEELDLCSDVLVRFSLKNAKSLSKAKIEFSDLKELEKHDCFLGLADRVRQIYVGICHAKYLTVEAPILAALRYQHLLPTFKNLNHLELQLQTCRCLQSLATLLKISPNLEHLKISAITKYVLRNEPKYCDDGDEDVLEHEWEAPEFAQTCLVSHLKTVCLWDFKGCPNDIRVAKYLVKHGKSLNKVTIHTRLNDDIEIKSQSPITLLSKFSNFPMASKNCEIEFQTIV